MKTHPPFFLQFLSITFSLILGLAQPDPDPLQDYCIGDPKSSSDTFFINGMPCLNPDLASASHFTTSVLARPSYTRSNVFGFNVTFTNVVNLPGLNTLGLTMARVDIAESGLVPFHSHPRASEVIICLKGKILVGFVDTSNRVFTETISLGESFVFPKGLTHFFYNQNPKSLAVAISGFNSQNPGVQIAPLAAFKSEPEIQDVILEKLFQINGQDLTRIRRNLGG